jgi:hypothetical protein
MQDDDDKDDGRDPYANDPPNPNLLSFELPDDDLDDEKWSEKLGPVFDRLGRPRRPSDYKWTADDDPDFGMSDEDRGYRDHMSRVFHRIGATQRQVSQLEKAQVQYLKTLRDGQTAKRSTAAQRARSELSRQWGKDADSRIAKANEALIEHGGRDAKALAQLELSDGTPLASHPAFIRMLANVGEAAPTKTGTVAEASQEIEKITKSALRQGLDPTSPHWPHKELEKLYRRVHGSESIDQTGANVV